MELTLRGPERSAQGSFNQNEIVGHLKDLFKLVFHFPLLICHWRFFFPLGGHLVWLHLVSMNTNLNENVTSVSSYSAPIYLTGGTGEGYRWKTKTSLCLLQFLHRLLHRLLQQFSKKKVCDWKPYLLFNRLINILCVLQEENEFNWGAVAEKHTHIKGVIKAGNFTFHGVEISLSWCRPYPIYALWAATTGLCNHKSITPENVTLPFTCGCTHFPCKKSRDCYRSSPSFRCRRRSGCRPCLCNETPSNNHLLRSEAL